MNYFYNNKHIFIYIFIIFIQAPLTQSYNLMYNIILKEILIANNNMTLNLHKKYNRFLDIKYKSMCCRHQIVLANK